MKKIIFMMVQLSVVSVEMLASGKNESNQSTKYAQRRKERQNVRDNLWQISDEWKKAAGEAIQRKYPLNSVT